MQKIQSSFVAFILFSVSLLQYLALMSSFHKDLEIFIIDVLLRGKDIVHIV